MSVGHVRDSKNARILLDEASEYFDSLSETEVAFINAVANGRSYCPPGVDESNAISDQSEQGCWTKWPTTRIIKASVIEWLCTSYNCRSIITRRGIDLRQALVAGKVDLFGANIPFQLSLIWCAIPDGIQLISLNAQNVNFHGSFFGPPQGISKQRVLELDRSRIDGILALKGGFRAYGPVSISGSYIRGDVCVDRSHFSAVEENDERSISLYAENIKVEGDFQMRKTHASGQISLRSSEIHGDLEISDVALDAPVALFLDGVSVHGIFTMLGDNIVPGAVDVSGMTCRVLRDRVASWPKLIMLSGFEYNKIDGFSDVDLNKRFEWLGRYDRIVEIFAHSPQMPSIQYNLSPYTQLAEVLRRQGWERESDAVLIRAAAIRHASMWPSYSEWRIAPRESLRMLGGWLVMSMYWAFLRYGYNRSQPLAWLLVLWAVGVCLFQIVPNSIVLKDYNGPIWLAPYLVSLDMLIPPINIGVRDSIDLNNTTISGLMYCISVAGWFLVSIWVVGLTGFVRGASIGKS
ncbi:MAG: hypothetical protein RLN76_05555 [Phycisphaeraceae bacterium]